MATTEDQQVSETTEGLKNMAVASDGEESKSQSALQENIESKGKNAYYFAHAHKATGPKWDGKPNPKLLGSRSLSAAESNVKTSGFEYHKSNITSYAFSDEGKLVKLYITMEEVGEKCSEEDIVLDWTESSLCLAVKNYKEEEKCLSFGRLAANITKASYKLKKDKLVVILKKETEGEWHTINDKGTPDREIV